MKHDRSTIAEDVCCRFSMICFIIEVYRVFWVYTGLHCEKIIFIFDTIVFYFLTLTQNELHKTIFHNSEPTNNKSEEYTHAQKTIKQFIQVHLLHLDDLHHVQQLLCDVFSLFSFVSFLLIKFLHVLLQLLVKLFA
jgi:hypothetical protein